MQKPTVTENDIEEMFWMLIAGFVSATGFVFLVIYLIFCQP